MLYLKRELFAKNCADEIYYGKKPTYLESYKTVGTQTKYGWTSDEIN